MTKKKRKWWDKQFFVFTVGMFGCDVAVAINLTEAEVEKHLRRRLENEDNLKQALGEMEDWDDGTNVGRMCEMGGDYLVLLRLKKEKPTTAHGLIVHEMVHVAQYLLRRRRVPLTEDTEEVHAYLTEHLVKQTLLKLPS